MSRLSEYAEWTGVVFQLTEAEKKALQEARGGAGATPTPVPVLSADEWNALGALVAGGALTFEEALAYAQTRRGEAGRLFAEVQAASTAKSTTVAGRTRVAIAANPEAARNTFLQAVPQAPTPTPGPAPLPGESAQATAFGESAPELAGFPLPITGSGLARATAKGAAGGPAQAAVAIGETPAPAAVGPFPAAGEGAAAGHRVGIIRQEGVFWAQEIMPDGSRQFRQVVPKYDAAGYLISYTETDNVQSALPARSGRVLAHGDGYYAEETGPGGNRQFRRLTAVEDPQGGIVGFSDTDTLSPTLPLSTTAGERRFLSAFSAGGRQVSPEAGFLPTEVGATGIPSFQAGTLGGVPLTREGAAIVGGAPTLPQDILHPAGRGIRGLAQPEELGGYGINPSGDVYADALLVNILRSIRNRLMDAGVGPLEASRAAPAVLQSEGGQLPAPTRPEGLSVRSDPVGARLGFSGAYLAGSGQASATRLTSPEAIRYMDYLARTPTAPAYELWEEPPEEMARGGQKLLRQPAAVVDLATGQPLATLAETQPEVMTAEPLNENLRQQLIGQGRMLPGQDTVFTPRNLSFTPSASLRGGGLPPPPTGLVQKGNAAWQWLPSEGMYVRWDYNPDARQWIRTDYMQRKAPFPRYDPLDALRAMRVA